MAEPDPNKTKAPASPSGKTPDVGKTVETTADMPDYKPPAEPGGTVTEPQTQPQAPAEK